MKKLVEVKGEVVRQEREKRAWTQEELSERTRLGVRTLRRLEAGYGSLGTLKRVMQALELKPEVALPQEPNRVKQQEMHSWLHFDPVMLETSMDLVGLVEGLVERIGSIRRHLAREMGFLMPGVRLRDDAAIPKGTYRIRIREWLAAEGQVDPERLLAIGKTLAGLAGEPTVDPTYAMPALRITAATRPEAEAAGCLVATPVDVVATHLTYAVRRNAWRLLGIEEVQQLLERLELPRLVAEVVPTRVSLVTLRAV